MQEVNERRQRRRSDDAIEDGQDVTETVSMLSHATLRQRSMPESWVRFAMDKLWSLMFLTVASLGLYEAQFVSAIVHAQIALLCTWAFCSGRFWSFLAGILKCIEACF
uniref:Uncharacterized protein n=1 Tax=Peronospora matthiolae TaxID=2874970 RepID=A0AAV1UWY9_9STRA